MEFRKMLMITLYAKQKKRHMYRTDFWTLWEKERVGCFKRTASKHVYYLGWNRSPAQVGFMRQVLGPGALGRPRGIGWRGRWEGGSGWGIHVNPWPIHVNVWQNPLQYCKVISLQLIKKKLCKTLTDQKALDIHFISSSDDSLYFWQAAIIWSYSLPPLGAEEVIISSPWHGEPRMGSTTLCDQACFLASEAFIHSPSCPPSHIF